MAYPGRRIGKPNSEKFIQCSYLSNFKMTPEDQTGSRAISEDKKLEWANECAAEHKEFGAKAPACIWGNAFLKHVRYIPFPEFYDALIKSLDNFLVHQGNRPYAIFVDSSKYGSEYWILQMLWKDVIAKQNNIPMLISEFRPDTDPSDIIILDDALYTGVHAFGALDDAFHQSGIRAPGNYRFHFVVPYITNQAKNYITENLSSSAVVFYPLSIIPTLLEFDEPEVKTSAYKLNERKKYTPVEEVINEFDLNQYEDMDFTPLYFDFKIAKNASTATKLLEKLVHPLPSRRALKYAEGCYSRF